MNRLVAATGGKLIAGRRTSRRRRSGFAVLAPTSSMWRDRATLLRDPLPAASRQWIGTDHNLQAVVETDIERIQPALRSGILGDQAQQVEDRKPRVQVLLDEVGAFAAKDGRALASFTGIAIR